MAISVNQMAHSILGRYVLSDPCVVVHLFSKHAPQTCTVWRTMGQTASKRPETSILE